MKSKLYVIYSLLVLVASCSKENSSDYSIERNGVKVSKMMIDDSDAPFSRELKSELTKLLFMKPNGNSDPFVFIDHPENSSEFSRSVGPWQIIRTKDGQELQNNGVSILKSNTSDKEIINLSIQMIENRFTDNRFGLSKKIQ